MSDASATPTTSNGQNSTERVVKKRASQACHHCRTRKVKCDLVKSGVPCHNCSSDGIECVILESRRSRKYRLQKRQLGRLVSLPPISQAQPKPACTESPTSNKHINSSNDADSIHGLGGQTNQGTPIIPALIPTNFQSPPVITPNTSIGTQSHVAAGGDLSTRGHGVDLPLYIRPSRPDIRQDDLEFLGRRGALSLPFGELRDQLLRSFVLYVYPFMPIVDLEDFMGAIDGNEASPKISLIVFQAILFSATAFVDLPLLQEAGYENRRAARADFYQKVKLLYDFDWDVDRVALIQSLLMLNYWYVSENDQKDPWHWLGICVSLATSIGLNQPFTYTLKDAKTSALWRRIWWCCLYRDRVISISMRRPMRISDEDIKLPLLKMDDFETTTVNSSIPCMRDCAFLRDAYTRTMLAEMCIAKIKLLVYVGQILSNFYHLRGFGGSTAESTMLYTPRRSEVNSKQYLDLQHDLDQWYRDLPPSCWLVTGSTNLDPDRCTADALLVHRSVLRMLYLMASEALNRPQSLSKPSSSTTSNRSSNGSTTSPNSKIKEAAERIAEMVESMQERDLIRFLPPLSVSFMLLALASFLVDIKAKGKSVGTLALPGQQFHVCVRALLRLREIWPIADAACFLIGQMITKHQVGKISTPGIQPAPIDASDAPPTNMWRDPGPETPRTSAANNLAALSSQYQNLNGGDLNFSSLAVDHTTTQQQQQPSSSSYLQPADNMTSTNTTTAAAATTTTTAAALSQDDSYTIPYTWTDEDFEGDYGPMVEAHALNMDLAMPDADVLAYFDNGAFDFNFEPSPPDGENLNANVDLSDGFQATSAVDAGLAGTAYAGVGVGNVNVSSSPQQQRAQQQQQASSMVSEGWNPVVASRYMESFGAPHSI